ncbi:MAG: NAD(P)-dependent oxidoreductase [Candidatus Poribacteria bacterium]|nr:NAD(P)-dependent oxidoreductase [Candidatus Poribacteria bacterium]
MRFSVLLREDFHIARHYQSEGCDLLRAHGQVDIATIKSGQEQEGLDQFLSSMKEADGAVVGPWYRPAMRSEHWHQTENLKVFAGTFDNRFANWVDFDLLESRGITLIDTSRSMTPSVAEFALAMTLNLIRDIPESMYLVRQGKWKEQPWEKSNFVYGDLTGRRVGLAGFGSINRRYAELVQPFRCSVRVYDPFVSDEVFSRYGVKRAESLPDLAESCEIFVIGLPPTPTTQGIISRDVIDALPNGALLVLVTRMAVVEQEALWRRIQAGEIAAAIDVFAPEPPPSDAWFRHHPNVLVTPHIAGGTDFCHRRCFTDACKDAIAVLTGGTPRFQATIWDHQCYEGKLKSPA